MVRSFCWFFHGFVTPLQFSHSQTSTKVGEFVMSCNSTDIRETDLGRCRGPSSGLSHPRRMEAVVRWRMQVLTFSNSPFWCFWDLIWWPSPSWWCTSPSWCILGTLYGVRNWLRRTCASLREKPCSTSAGATNMWLFCNFFLLQGNLSQSLLWRAFPPPPRSCPRIWWTK